MGNSTFTNAVIGAVVTVASSALTGPVGPVLGGIVAGYLQRRDGFEVGAISGFIATIPVVLVFFLVGSFFLSFFFTSLDPSFSTISGVGIVFVVGILGVILFVSVLLSGFGGYLGVYIATETGVGSQRR